MNYGLLEFFFHFLFVCLATLIFLYLFSDFSLFVSLVLNFVYCYEIILQLGIFINFTSSSDITAINLDNLLSTSVTGAC